MIRPFTVLCLLTACGSGLYLYSEKHRTELLDRDIGHVIHATEAARARTGLLRAEWALLNEPGRLQDMAGRYLTLHPMTPAQFVPIVELSSHLPAPIATPPDGSADEDDTSQPAAASNPVVANVAPESAAPLKSVAAAESVAAPEPVPASRHPMMPVHADLRPGTKLLASANVHARAQHHVAMADRMSDTSPHDGLLTHGTPLPLAVPQPLGASVYSAMARPMRGTSAHPAIVAAVPSYAPAQGYVHSALGGSAALPPPVPYGR